MSPAQPGEPGELVVLVDDADVEVGMAPKLDAHRAPGQRHRAFSVFAHDDEHRLLVQRRASTKYHFGGLWSNACCSHPRPGEAVADAALRRLREEMGVEADRVTVLGMFEYRATDAGSGLVEHELDHVVLARVANDPTPDPSEADAFRWLPLAELQAELADTPSGMAPFTPWFRPALEVVLGAGWPPERPT